MEVKQPSAEGIQLLAELRKRGGVIDYVVMESHQPSGSVYDLHKQAAVLTLQTLALPWAWRGTVVNQDLAHGERISASEFVGPYFDHEKQSLVMTDVKNSTGSLTDFLTYGYADAFSNPPYKLKGTLEDFNRLFLSLSRVLLGELDANSEIYKWSIDWSGYFDAGKEWWGAFLWTVHNKKQGTYVGVAASTTD